jgi:hypothetical protein
VIDPDVTAAGQLALYHPDWCDRFRCTAEKPDGIHISEPTTVALGEHPADGATIERIQTVATLAAPDPPVKIGIKWRGIYSRLTPMVIPLDRAQLFGEALLAAAHAD